MASELESARFAQARQRLQALEERERNEAELAPENAARWWLHDTPTERAVVLLHGITNSPQQYAVLAQQLFEDGHTVIAPRFPYHGYRDRMTTALEALTVEDMLAASLEAIAIAALTAERVDLVGISVGATVAAFLALKVAVDRVIAVAPFFGIIYFPAAVSDALAVAFMRVSNTYSWWDPIHQIDQLPTHAYPRFPTLALARALSLSPSFEHAEVGPDHARRLTLVLNANDPIVNNGLAWKRAREKQSDSLSVAELIFNDLPHMHDIIEPTLPHAPSDKVYPVLRDLIGS